MDTVDMDSLNWAGKCESNACLEKAVHDGYVYLRSTTDPDTVVTVTQAEWDYFIMNVA